MNFCVTAGGWRLSGRGCLLGLAMGGACLSGAHAQSVAAKDSPKKVGALLQTPTLREVWVPADALDPVLARYPRAVALSREELFTLLCDAQPPDAVQAELPERAVLRSAHLEGRLVNGSDGAPDGQVQVSAEIEVTVFTDQWAEVDLGLPAVALGRVELDAAGPVRTQGALKRGMASSNRTTSLLIQGRGPHRLRLDFVLPVETRDASRRVYLPAIKGLAEFTLHLPADTWVESTLGCQLKPEHEPERGVLARVALRVASDKTSNGPNRDWLAWKSEQPRNVDPTAPVLQECQVDYLVEEASVTARMDMQITSPLGRLPAMVDVPLPAGLRVARVEGASVRGWSLAADHLRIDLTASAAGQLATVTVFYEIPAELDPSGQTTRTNLPLLEINGAHSVAGRLVLRRGRGMDVRRVEPTGIATPAPQLFGQAMTDAPDFVAGFALADLPRGTEGASSAGTSPPVLMVESRKVTVRYEVDADTVADFQPGAVRIERRLTFHVAEGEVFAARVVLPKGEEILAVQETNPGGTEPDWRREDHGLVLEWRRGLRRGASTAITLQTRAELAPVNNDHPAEYTLGTVAVPAAVRVTGYVAVKTASGFQIAMEAEDHLERRDVRTTPVRGEMAWFYRDQFRLALRIERRAAQTEVEFTGFALPLGGSMEVRGQLAYHFHFSGAEAVKVRVPKDLADAFAFTGAHIAERRLEDDVWTIRFQSEQTGDYALGVQATLPFPVQSVGTERFHVRLPMIQPVDVARWSGVWAVEANTDTEIRFAASGASEADALHAPTVAGYAPRQRVIAVFEFIGSEPGPAIDLDGVRHPPAATVAGMVDNLELDTFVATSGAQRYRAVLLARTAATGFFNIRLPVGSALWSLTLDDALVKPVGGSDGGLWVELPGGRAPSAASRIVLVYERPAKAWNASGRTALVAPQFDSGVPVLKSRWKLHLPDGFDYDDFSLPIPGTGGLPEPLLFHLPTALLHAFAVFGSAQYKAAVPASSPVEFNLADRLGDSEAGPSATPAVMAAATPDSRATPMPSAKKSATTDQNAPYNFILRNPREGLGVDHQGRSGFANGGAASGLEPSSPVAASTESARMEKRVSSSVTGLLPIRLDLPENGREFEISKEGEPGEVAFRYIDWRSAARRRWVWLTLGGAAFFLLAAGWKNPSRRWVLGVIALTFFPLVVAPSWAGVCNHLLGGWLLATLGWLVTRRLLRRPVPVKTALIGAVLVGFVGTSPATRAATPPGPSPSPVMVIVPYDASKPAAEQQPGRYYLPYERFIELWDAAKAKHHPPAPRLPGGESYVLSTAGYDGQIVGETLVIDGVIDLQTLGEGWVRVPLDFAGAEIGAVLLDGVPAGLGGDGSLWIGTAAAHRIEVKLRVPAPKLTSASRIAWNIPRTAATRLTVTTSWTDLRVELGSTPGGAVSEIVPEGRRLTTSIGGAERVELSFREEAPRAAAGFVQPPLAHLASRVWVHAAREEVRAEARFAFPGGSQDHFALSFDPGLTLLDLDVPNVKSWHLDRGAVSATLEIVLQEPAKDAYRFSLTTDRRVDTLPDPGRLYPVFGARAGRVEQTAALWYEEGLEITLPSTLPPGYRRVESPPAEAGAEHLAAAFETTGGAQTEGAALTYGIRKAAAQSTASIHYLYQIGRAEMDLAASVRLVPPVGGQPILAAHLQLPPGFEVQAVEGGAKLQQWWRGGDVLSLRFRADGASAKPVELLVYLVRRSDPAEATFDLRPIVVRDAVRTEGEVVVAADQRFVLGLSMAPGRSTREMEEIDARAAAGDFQVRPPLERQRAFRYRGANFEATVTRAVQTIRWDATWVAHASVHEGFVAVEWHVNAMTRQGELDAWEFLLPASVPPARISGPEVREAVALPPEADGRRRYRVIFQNPIYGNREANFTVNVELPVAGGGKAAVPDIAFPDAGTEGKRIVAGFVLIENLSDGEMALDAHGLDPAAIPDLPFKPAQTAAGARCFRAPHGVPWHVEIQMTGLVKTSGRNALVAYVEMTSTLRPSGEEWHRAVYRLQNRQLQFLPVELPPGVEFIGARVAGETVRVDAGEPCPGSASLLVPLLKTRPGEISYDVELVYHRPAPAKPPSTFINRHLEAPRLVGVPVEKTLWNVWLPTGEHLIGNGGNVEPVLATLSETEKLESTLDDLRSLSATYASNRATVEERQRALSNFDALAGTVTRSGDDVLTRNRSVDAGPGNTKEQGGVMFRDKDVASQQAAVERRQQAIRQELSTLTTHNSSVKDQHPWASTSEHAGWLDQRGTGRKAPPFSGAIGGNIDAKQVPLATQNGRGQLALNDELAFQLPSAENEKTKTDVPANETPAFGKDGADRRLNTARATGPQQAQGATSEALTRSDSFGAELSNLEKAATAATTGAQPAPAPKTAAAPPTGATLRSNGRISLAIEFPQEGQVYHFKKVKADAILTLSTVQPANFKRLGWLAVTLLILAACWVVRRALRHPSFFRRPVMRGIQVPSKAAS